MAGNRRKFQSTKAAATVRAASGGLARALLKLASFGAVVAALGFAGRVTYRWATTSSTFAIHSIVIRGNLRASADELVRTSGLTIGENLFTSDVEAAESALANEPWVKTVEVHRRLPDSVVIRVTEREPALLVDLGKLYFADSDGALFKRVATGDELDLPIVTGLTRDAFQDQRAEIEARLRDVYGFVQLYRERKLEARFRIEELNVDPEEGLTAQLSRIGAHGDMQSVRLGEAPYEDKLQKLEALWNEFQRRGVTARVIHLENRARPNWVAVQLALAAPAQKLH